MFKALCLMVVAACVGCLGAAMPERSFAAEVAADNDRKTLRERLRERRSNRTSSRGDQPVDARKVAKITEPGSYLFSMVHAGMQRSYRVHVPAGYLPSRPAPLVFSLHGGGGSMDIQANDAFYGQISKAEEAGFIAVFPNGFSRLKSGLLATWNAGNCCASARDENIDDVGFVRQIVERLSGQLNIDPQRIFANGMSNGGMMSYRLACEMSDVFKAIASVAGTDNTKSCSPTAPISILHIHAKDDDLELFDGGAGRQSAKVTDFVAVPDSIRKWVTFNECTTTPKRVFENDGASCDAYAQCRGGVEVKLCVTETGGHSWPGGKAPRGDKQISTAISATDVIWDFFASR